jgi:hypothetical protein
MAFPAYDPEKHSALALMARDLGCDYIRLSPNDFQRMRFDPDVTATRSHRYLGALFGGPRETERKELFWCREVEWSIGGRRFCCAVPVKFKWESTCALFGTIEDDVPRRDDQAEMEWLRKAISRSREMPLNASYIDLPEEL